MSKAQRHVVQLTEREIMCVLEALSVTVAQEHFAKQHARLHDTALALWERLEASKPTLVQVDE